MRRMMTCWWANTCPEVTQSDARKYRRRGPVRAVHHGVDDVDAVRVIGRTEQRVEHEQLSDHVADVQQLDEQVQSDQVVAVMTTEPRKQQSRQRVLQTERPFRQVLLNDADWTVVGERHFRRQISTTDNSHVVLPCGSCMTQTTRTEQHEADTLNCCSCICD